MYHTNSSAVLAVASYMVSNSVPVAISSLLAGILIDSDHAIDYALGGNSTRLGITNYESYANQTKLRKIFHSWELVALIFAFIIALHQYQLAFWITASLLLHIISDQIYYKRSNLYFFFVYRLKRNFNPDA